MGQTVTAYLCCDGAAEAIAFYTKAFGAKERYHIPVEGGRIGHAELEIGGSVIYLSDEWPEGGVYSPKTVGRATASFVLDVDDVDAAWQRAVDAGATVERPVKDEPYGRGGWLFDPFGHRWNIQQPKADFDPASMAAEAVSS